MSFFFCKQKTAYELSISDWSSDVCSSDLRAAIYHLETGPIQNCSPAILLLKGGRGARNRTRKSPATTAPASTPSASPNGLPFPCDTLPRSRRRPSHRHGRPQPCGTPPRHISVNPTERLRTCRARRGRAPQASPSPDRKRVGEGKGVSVSGEPG